jgi:two-component system, sensor histidine kinase and response regulator
MSGTFVDNKNKDEIIAELEAQIAELKFIVNNTSGNVFWKSTSGHYLGCNINVAKLLNLNSPDDIIGKEDVELLGAETAARVTKNDALVIESEQERALEEIGWDADLKPAVFLTVKKPLFDMQGKIKGVMGVSMDITERKRMEEKLVIAKQKAEEASRAKSQFLATISHELRTPLSSILGFASMIEQPNLPANTKKEYTQHIIDSGSYLLSLINSLLDYNKLETNKYEFVLLPLNLKELMVHVINMLSGAAKLKHLPLILEYDPDVPEYIMSNNRTLRQILINLIGNAIKFTDHGQITLHASCLGKNEQSAKLRISVKDTGAGIELKEQQSIFRRFYQTGNIYTRNNNFPGTGLGLAIVKKLVKLIGGKIAVKSAPNEGSEFYFVADFPIVSSKDVPWLAYAATVKILVAQDDQAKNYIHTLLANSFYEVVSPKSIVNQLLAAQQSMRPYDIVMLDNNIPEVNVIELVKSIREHANIQPFIILLTNTYPTDEERKHFAEIILNPASLDVKIFQLELKLAWERTLLNHKKNSILSKCPSTPNVLLIEDNLLIQIIHKSMLEELNCNVKIASTAKETLDLLKNGYDILFVDIGLPDMAGFELIKKIREFDDHSAHIPIIVLTGYSDDEDRKLFFRVGANEVVIKPVDKDNLSKLLNRYIKK